MAIAPPQFLLPRAAGISGMAAPVKARSIPCQDQGSQSRSHTFRIRARKDLTRAENVISLPHHLPDMIITYGGEFKNGFTAFRV